MLACTHVNFALCCLAHYIAKRASSVSTFFSDFEKFLIGGYINSSVHTPHACVQTMQCTELCYVTMRACKSCHNISSCVTLHVLQCVVSC